MPKQPLVIDQVFTHSGCCIFDVNLKATGYRGGDAGHGGFIKLDIINQAGTAMSGNVDDELGDYCNKISIKFSGDDEMTGLVDVLENVVKTLREKYPKNPDILKRLFSL
jgi:hypothetical protein